MISPGIPSYHNFKLLQPGVLGFYDNVVNNSTPTQLMHFYYGGPYQNTLFPIPLPPNVNMQNGWSQDIAAGLDGISSRSITRPGMMPRCTTST